MRAYEIRGQFGLAHLEPVDRPTPEPGPGQIRLRMRAVSLNFRDLLMVRGHYDPRQALPLIPCSDGVGEVTALGSGVEGVAEGDRVIPIFAPGWRSGAPTKEKISTALGGPLDGTLAESMVVDAGAVVPAPAHLSDAEAACLPCAGVTAWSALVTQAHIRPGDVVLTLGTGGVSIFAIQFARLMGARVIATSSNDEKLARAIALGAHEGINYVDEPRWSKAVHRLTGGRGADLVVEVGGAGTIDQSLRAVRTGGHVALIGVLAGAREPVQLTRILMPNVRVQGILVGHREAFVEMNRAMMFHQLRPVVDRLFGFDDVVEAFEYLAAGRHFGKVAIGLS